MRRRLAKLLYGQAFRKWAELSGGKSRMVSAHVADTNSLLQRKAFKRWQDNVHDMHKHFDSVRHHVATLIERQYRWVWNMWYAEHQAVCRRYHTLAEVGQRVLGRCRLRSVFLMWKGEDSSDAGKNAEWADKLLDVHSRGVSKHDATRSNPRIQKSRPMIQRLWPVLAHNKKLLPEVSKKFSSIIIILARL